MMSVSRSNVHERRLALARSLHRKRSVTQERALDLRVAIDACRSSLRAIDSRVGALTTVDRELRELQDRMHACASRLDHALEELATLTTVVRPRTDGELDRLEAPQP
jgi:hypothetical protein